MAHTLHGSFGQRAHQGSDPPNGGWWKFGAFAVAATVAGALSVEAIFSLEDGEAPAQVGTLPAPVQAIKPPVGLLIESLIKPPAVEQALAQQPALPTTNAVTEAPPPAITSEQPAPRTSLPAGIRATDLAALPALQALARQLNGRIDTARVLYQDLTGDGADEAVVPVTSDGTLGDLAFVVLKAGDREPQAILIRFATRDRQGLVVSFDGTQLTETSAVYGPNDPLSSPGKLVRTYFRWTGEALVVDHINTITVPQGKQAD